MQLRVGSASDSATFRVKVHFVRVNVMLRVRVSVSVRIRIRERVCVRVMKGQGHAGIGTCIGCTNQCLTA